MFGRLLMALGLKKKPAARMGGVARLQAAMAGGMPGRTSVMGSRPAAAREKPRKAASKSAHVSRRPDVDDDGFPQTMISSFPDSAHPRSRLSDREEAELPMPFRSHGGGEFGGARASASWHAKPSAAASCWVGSSDTGASVGSSGSHGDGGSCSSSDSGSSSSSSSSD